MVSFWQMIGYGFAASLGFWLATSLISFTVILLGGVKMRTGMKKND